MNKLFTNIATLLLIIASINLVSCQYFDLQRIKSYSYGGYLTGVGSFIYNSEITISVVFENNTRISMELQSINSTNFEAILPYAYYDGFQDIEITDSSNDQLYYGKNKIQFVEISDPIYIQSNLKVELLNTKVSSYGYFGANQTQLTFTIGSGSNEKSVNITSINMFYFEGLVDPTGLRCYEDVKVYSNNNGVKKLAFEGDDMALFISYKIKFDECEISASTPSILYSSYIVTLFSLLVLIVSLL